MATNPKEIFFCKLVADEGLVGVVVLGGAVVAVALGGLLMLKEVVIGVKVGTRGAVVVVWTPTVVDSLGEGEGSGVKETSGLGEGETEGVTEMDDIVVVLVLVVWW